MPRKPWTSWPCLPWYPNFHGMLVEDSEENSEALVKGETDGLKKLASFDIAIQPGDHFLRKFGSRIQSLLICQPPTKEISISMRCCYCAPPEHPRWPNPHKRW
ncbi:hypothetical protein DOTSEDRAFT_25386 [Dothistroma septosporum NZE10]|uniref:Uncharacterized protein n=1 Tax=Dothistroma septosporum (strain NZE10 / CBS 128990) TaxID=675120 RepID=M2Y5D2_DOTSN|nr:hypothetical protein DOTSEDRAFT_25386 [Dothistroma septosporum NZE10]